MLNFINKTEITERLLRSIECRGGNVEHPITGDSITIHKTAFPNWYGIGPGDRTWINIRLPADAYLEVKQMLIEICAELGLAYQEMDDANHMPEMQQT